MSSFVIYQLIDGDFVFKVPEIIQEQIVHKKVHNILLCDSSGSMDSYWAKVASGWNNLIEKLDGSVSLILFSEIAYKYAGKTLPLNMLYSGGTDIIAGLNELQKELKTYANYDLIRVFFITDGEDSNSSTFKSRFENTINTYYKPTNLVEFYVLGLTDNFPVYISQAIRVNIHTGRNTIPNLFWSQNGSEQEINEEFKSIQKQNKNINKITLPCDGRISPFDTKTNTFYTGDWVLIDKNDVKTDLPNWFECDGNIFQLEINFTHTFDDLLEIFAQWIGILQTTSIKFSSDINLIKLNALQVKQQIEQIYNDFINSNAIVHQMKTFSQRLLDKKIKTKTYLYQSYMKIANNLASGIKMEFMNNIELAKQLKGVYVGKYSEKAFQLRSHTDEDFEKDKLEFIKVLQNILPSLKDIENDECCAITLDNTLNIIRSDDFIDTLKNTESKIEFLQNIGITGNGVLLNITDAYTINPWVTQIKDVSVHCDVISTVAIEELIENSSSNVQLTHYEKDNCTVAIPIGDGNIEKINCVIPLFKKEIAELLGPIVRTNLFQLICTYSIQKSPLTLNHYAHLGALSGLFGYILTKPKSEWRKNIINKIKYTTNIYLNRIRLQKFVDILWENPARAVITEIPNDEIKCESITKLLLMILVSAKDKTPEQLAEVMCHVWKEYIGRLIGTNNNVSKWFDFENPDALSEQIIFPDFESVYSHEFTVMETKKEIEKAIRTFKYDKPQNLNVKLNIDKLTNEWNGGSVGNISWMGLKEFTNVIGCTITDDNVFQYLTHGLIHSSSLDRMNKILNFEDSKDWVINELIGLKFTKFREQIINEYKIKGDERYSSLFVLEHQTILPMHKNTIIQEATNLGIDVCAETFDSVYQFNPNSKLLSNACMSKECPYYLIPRNDFSSHIEKMKSAPDFIHSYHRTIYACKNKPINNIIDNLIKGQFRPVKYLNNPINTSKKILIEHTNDIEINKNIYMSIHDD